MMLSHEEALICCIELYRRGYRHIVYWGRDREGWHVRACWVHPLSPAGLRYPLIQIDEPEELAQHLRPGRD
jgi:hypothetical protein